MRTHASKSPTSQEKQRKINNQADNLKKILQNNLFVLKD